MDNNIDATAVKKEDVNAPSGVTDSGNTPKISEEPERNIADVSKPSDGVGQLPLPDNSKQTVPSDEQNSGALMLNEATNKDQHAFTKLEFLKRIVGDYQSKTMVINPFSTDILALDEFQTCIEKTKEFYLRRISEKKSVAFLEFHTTMECEEALDVLTEKLVTESSKTTVYHPWFDISLEKCINHQFLDESLGIDKMANETVFGRQLVFNAVPDNVTLEKFEKKFPQALNITDMRQNTTTKGIVVVEFSSRKEALDLVNSAADSQVVVDAVKLKVDVFPEDADVFGRHYTRENLINYVSKTEQTKSLNDHLRVNMCKAHKALAEEKCRLFNRTDIYSQDKKTENSRISGLMRPYEEHLIADTKRRLDAGDTRVPEHPDHMISAVRTIMKADKSVSFTPTTKQPSAKLIALMETAHYRASLKLEMMEQKQRLLEEKQRLQAEKQRSLEEKHRKAAEALAKKSADEFSQTAARQRRAEDSPSFRGGSHQHNRNSFSNRARAAQEQPGDETIVKSMDRKPSHKPFSRAGRGQVKDVGAPREWSPSPPPAPSKKPAVSNPFAARFASAQAAQSSWKASSHTPVQSSRQSTSYAPDHSSQKPTSHAPDKEPDTSNAVDTLQSELEGKLRRYEESQLKTLEIQAKMLAAAKATLKDTTE